MSDKSDGKRMSTTDWVQEVSWVCGPRLPRDTRESWLSRGAKRAGVTYRQLKALFHRETEDPKHSVGQRVLSTAKQRRNEARKELLELAAKLHNAADGLNAIDADFHGPVATALVEQARQLGLMAGTGIKGAGE